MSLSRLSDSFPGVSPLFWFAITPEANRGAFIFCEFIKVTIRTHINPILDYIRFRVCTEFAFSGHKHHRHYTNADQNN